MATLDGRLLGVAVAHGITPRMVATWNAQVSRSPRALVPIQLDALVVRDQGGTWAQVAMKPPDDNTTVDAHTLLAPPFAEIEPRQPGAYLHWALPDALTHGTGTAASGDATFPPIPDRWLVARISTPKVGGRRDLAAWVLETGGKDPVRTDLDAWTETQDPDATTSPAIKPLTALGHGDAGWAAYYDNVQDRLAFYDALTGVQGPVAYLVCGWHSRYVDDPIGENLTSPAAFEARLDELGWEIDPADVEGAFVYSEQAVSAATNLGLATREMSFTQAVSPDVGKSYAPEGVHDAPRTHFLKSGAAYGGRWAARLVSWPELALYHGAVVGLGWPGPGIGVAPDGLLGGDAGGPPDPAAVTVTLGSTLTDALATRLAQTTGSPEQARALEAVLIGAVDELDQPDAAARVDGRLHATAFGSLPGGIVTEPVTQHRPVAPTATVPDPSRTDPGVFARQGGDSGGLAGATGTTGTRVGTGAKAYAAAAGKLFSKDGGSLVARTQQSPSQTQRPKFAVGGLDEVVATVSAYASAANPSNIKVRVPHVGGGDDATPVTVASERALPRFFVPADPVFLLEGAGRSFKHGADRMHTESGKLVCRLSGHTVTDLMPRVLAGAGATGVRGEDLLARGLEHGSIPPECEDLLRELALLDPGSAESVVTAPSGAPRFGVLDRAVGPQVTVAAQARTVAVEQTAWWVARDERRDLAPLLAASGLAGTLPSPVAVSPPVKPWVPLHLDWEVQLFASPRWADWQLGEVDFDAVASTVPAADATPTQTLTGRALLNGGAAQVAAAAVRQVLEQAQKAGGSTQLERGVTHAYHSPAAQEMVAAISTLRSGAVAKAALDAKAADAKAAAGAKATQAKVRPADARAAAARAKAAEQAPQVSADVDVDLDHVVDELERMDVLVGAMDRFNSQLRAGFVADGASQPDPAGPVPDGFWPVRSGFLRVTRLRLVDCFGQTLDLVGPDAGTPSASDDVLRSEPLTVDGSDDLVELAPRFTAPTRLWFRFLAADDDGTDADDATSPVCGFVLPNHLDGDLQLYASDGTGLGAVRFDAAAGVVWEEAPGQPTALGSTPSGTVQNPHLAGIAQGLLDWGAVDASPDAPATDTALSSLLRVVDASLWGVDPFGHVGEEHLALLVGHPVAVLRAVVRVEVAEPVAPDLVAGMRVPVRLGALAHWQDGLLAYFVGDDYRTLRVPDPACADFARPVGPNEGFNGQATSTSGYYDRFASDLGVESHPGSTPVDHPFVDPSGIVWLQPGQDVLLTLLVEPHSVVHATTGYLPRKEIGMRRAWVAPGLAKLAPVFRFGPVLVDPKLVRMPVASDIRGTWSWSHRSDATTWADDPITNSTGDARVPANPSQGQEGWLKLTPDEPLP